MLTDSDRIWERKFTDFLRGEREQAYGLLTDSYRIWERKLTDFLRGEREQAYGLLTDSYRIWERKLDFLRIFYGVKESRLTDCLRILTGFGKESLRIFYGFFTG